jgi:hypothetical protein
MHAFLESYTSHPPSQASLSYLRKPHSSLCVCRRRVRVTRCQESRNLLDCHLAFVPGSLIFLSGRKDFLCLFEPTTYAPGLEVTFSVDCPSTGHWQLDGLLDARDTSMPSTPATSTLFGTALLSKFFRVAAQCFFTKYGLKEQSHSLSSHSHQSFSKDQRLTSVLAS